MWKVFESKIPKSEQFSGEVAMLKSLRNWTCTTHFEICFGSAKKKHAVKIRSEKVLELLL